MVETLTVAIDPGHGWSPEAGGDPGTIWPPFVASPNLSADLLLDLPAGKRNEEIGKLLAAARARHVRTCTHVEATLTMHLARYLQQRIQHSSEPVRAVLLRGQEAENQPLNVRGSLSSAASAGMVLSLHFNAGAPTQRGSECYYWPGNERMRDVGDAILDAMPPPLRRPSRRSFEAVDTPDPQDDWLRHPRAVLGVHSCPALLVEVGYLTREEDRAAIDDPATQAAICSALEVGIARWRQLVESPHIARL